MGACPSKAYGKRDKGGDVALLEQADVLLRVDVCLAASGQDGHVLELAGRVDEAVGRQGRHEDGNIGRAANELLQAAIAHGQQGLQLVAGGEVRREE